MVHNSTLILYESYLQLQETFGAKGDQKVFKFNGPLAFFPALWMCAQWGT